MRGRRAEVGAESIVSISNRKVGDKTEIEYLVKEFKLVAGDVQEIPNTGLVGEK